MNFITKILQVLRVDGISFVLSLGLAWTLHFGGLLWDPLDSHAPDISSGLYICGVLLLLMQPFRRQPVQSFRRSVWLNSLKISLSLMLLQHVALIGIWDSFSWLLNCTLYHWAPKCRLLLSLMVLCHAVYRWLSRQRAEAFIPMPAALEQYCPYCSALCSSDQLLPPPFIDRKAQEAFDAFLSDALLN